jgi:acyl-homoserine lactone acylase PvdQ
VTSAAQSELSSMLVFRIAAQGELSSALSAECSEYSLLGLLEPTPYLCAVSQM